MAILLAVLSRPPFSCDMAPLFAAPIWSQSRRAINGVRVTFG
jgi:hypothetical protein